MHTLKTSKYLRYEALLLKDLADIFHLHFLSLKTNDDKSIQEISN